ncbi:hypothetical protein PMIN01_08699 [Paraphaeosphaeria minitans]|uniref:Uncharacterized protein n=1 Tax=Paraphaeosphaeria minitans TaxID=565426 RepID=A0A9P6GCF9_9PLEO|nr:hypothetical protein PMIN01_08699 [Paraphaeosphaeria minitans]
MRTGSSTRPASHSTKARAKQIVSSTTLRLDKAFDGCLPIGRYLFVAKSSQPSHYGSASAIDPKESQRSAFPSN